MVVGGSLLEEEGCWILSGPRQSSMSVMMVTVVVRPFQSCMLRGKKEKKCCRWLVQLKTSRFPVIWAQYLTWENTCQTMSKLEEHCQPMFFFFIYCTPSIGLRVGELRFMSTSCFFLF